MDRRQFLDAGAALTGSLGDGAEATTNEDSPQSEGDGTKEADCGDDDALHVGIAGAEMFVPPEDATIEINSYHPAESDESHVTLTLRTPRETGGISMRLFLTPEESRSVAERLESAAVRGSRERLE